MSRRFGTIYQRPGRDGFYVRFRRRGRETARYGGRTRRIAGRKLDKAAALFDDGESWDVVLAVVFGDFTGERMTFRDAVPHYLKHAEQHKKPSTFKRDVVRLAPILRESWTDRNLAEIRPEHLVRWVDARRRGGASGPTVNRDLAIVSAVYEWAKLMGYCDRNPARRVPHYSEKGRERETYLTEGEARALTRAARDDFRPLLVCALSTGMRRGELLALTWPSVDFKRATLGVMPCDDKTGRGRVVPMTQELRGELVRLQGLRQVFRVDGQDPVFLRADGRPWTVPMVRTAFSRALAVCQAIPESKRGKVTFHTLRHTAASLMAQRGIPLLDVGAILGHRTMQMTMRYAHFAPDGKRAAIAALGEALAFPPPHS